MEVSQMRRRVIAVLFATAIFSAGLAAPALADPGGPGRCPPSWTTSEHGHNEFSEDADKNGNGFYCYKDHSGRGNNVRFHDGENHKDDHI